MITGSNSTVESKEGQGRLSAEEERKVGHIISEEGGEKIELDDDYLLSEAVGSESASLPMGGNEINPVIIMNKLKEFIISTKRELYSTDSLSQMPVVALVKALAMRIGNDDCLCLADFSTMVLMKPHTKVYQKRKISGVSQELYAVDASGYVFAHIDSIGNFSYAVNGLREVLNRLVHPSIMSGESLMKRCIQDS